jgi:DNA primase
VIARSLKVLDHYRLLDGAKLVAAEIAILCPYHEEDSPSCHVWLEDERFKCFGCGKFGDLADLVARFEHSNKLDALIQISRIMRDLEAAYSGELGTKIVLAERYASAATTDEEALKQSEIFFFSLSEPSWDDISSHYLIDDRGFTPETLKHFDARINASSDYPVIFPVYENSIFKGYMTRALDNREDKYRMSRGMRKTNILYGTVTPGLPVIVTEGAFDAWKSWQNLRYIGRKGITVASPLNWATSDVQMEKLVNASVVVAAFDNDTAGREGAKQLAARLGRPVLDYPLPSWIHDMAELEPREFQAGLEKALGANKGERI